MLHNILWGVVPAMVYLAMCGLRNGRRWHSADSPKHRSTHRLPVSQVPTEDRSVQLRTAMNLVQMLTNSEQLWVSARTDAEAWLKRCEQHGSQDEDLLKQAYELLKGIADVHRAVPALTKESAGAVNEWLDGYTGTEDEQ